jgi:Mat/Ecp fimbriae major subunit
MKKLFATAGALAALALTSTPAAAVSPTTQATASAKIYKPLQISFVQNLDFGVLVLGSGAWVGQVIKIDETGAMTGCGSNVTCSGSPQQAKYHLVGTNNATVKITSPNFNLSGPGSPAPILAFTPVFQPTVNLGPNGLLTGVDFGMGGQITLDSTTPDGLYTGTFNVTADYQ